ncbi:MAG TPA: TonB family protein [Paludibacter sp.]|nr:TonB family protein [Paludibacter sp.]
MTQAALHFIVVNIALSLFYACYKFLLAQDTFLQTKRIYLQFSFLFSLFLPMANLNSWFVKHEIVPTVVANAAVLPEIYIAPAKSSFAWNAESVLVAVYALVGLALIIRFLVRLTNIANMRKGGRERMLFDTKVIELHQDIAPFSFARWIFVNPTLHTETELKEILAHESIHVKQAHSVDVIISELMLVFFWTNPFVWLLRQEIRQNLEFIADNKVVESGVDSKAYQYHLLKLSCQQPDIKFTNNFNILPLKKRITMMNKQKTSKAGLLKYSLIVPLAMALIFISNAQTGATKTRRTTGNTTNQAVKTQPEALQKKNFLSTTTPSPELTEPNTQTPTKNQVYDVCEKLPEYPGGMDALMKYLSQNIKYPIKAQENGIQGKVFVQFVVNSVGKIENAEIIKNVSPEIDAEALRVVNSMPQWTPGEQKGEKVSVHYTLPIGFTLDSGNARHNPVVLVDGKQMPAGYDISKNINPSNMAKMVVIKVFSEEEQKGQVEKYGQDALNGVIEITLKK